jgi:hypothetical protein
LIQTLMRPYFMQRLHGYTEAELAAIAHGN